MKIKTSAGGVIVSLVKRQWHVLILRDMNGMWTFPKGLIEKGENPKSAAMREITEEVGIDRLTLYSPLTPIQYFYKRNGTIEKTVHYFLFTARTRIRPKPQKEEGISDAKWVPIKRAREIIGYRKTNVVLLEEAWKLLKPLTSRD